MQINTDRHMLELLKTLEFRTGLRPSHLGLSLRWCATHPNLSTKFGLKDTDGSCEN